MNKWAVKIRSTTSFYNNIHNATAVAAAAAAAIATAIATTFLLLENGHTELDWLVGQ